MSAQLTQLVTQLREHKPARSDDVVTGQAQLSQDLGVSLQVQSQRIDTVSDSVQRIEKDSADNAKLLHELLVNMENMGESVRFLKEEVRASWGQEDDVVMETDEDRQHQQMQQALLEEVSLLVSQANVINDPNKTTPMVIPVLPVPTMSGPSVSSIPSEEEERMKQRVDQLLHPAGEGQPEKSKKRRKIKPL